MNRSMLPVSAWVNAPDLYSVYLPTNWNEWRRVHKYLDNKKKEWEIWGRERKKKRNKKNMYECDITVTDGIIFMPHPIIVTQ